MYINYGASDLIGFQENYGVCLEAEPFALFRSGGRYPAAARQSNVEAQPVKDS